MRLLIWGPRSASDRPCRGKGGEDDPEPESWTPEAEAICSAHNWEIAGSTITPALLNRWSARLPHRTQAPGQRFHSRVFGWHVVHVAAPGMP